MQSDRRNWMYKNCKGGGKITLSHTDVIILTKNLRKSMRKLANNNKIHWEPMAQNNV